MVPSVDDIETLARVGDDVVEAALEVRCTDLAVIRTVERQLPSLEVGEVLLRVECFAMTANNVTYARLGDRLGYWRLFPAGIGWGRIPAWERATVSRSMVQALPAGTRVYGLVPMATHAVLTADRFSADGFVDAAPHRQRLPRAYNRYRVVTPSVPVDDVDRRSTLEPLFLLSLLTDAWLAEQPALAGADVLFTSGSSLAAIGTAFLLRRRGVRVSALTSLRRHGLVTALGLYDDVLPYGDANRLVPAPTVIADLAGDDAVIAAARAVLGDDLVHVIRMGMSHGSSTGWSDRAASGETRLFVPDLLVQRAQEWGRPELERRLATELASFSAWTEGWLQLRRSAGRHAVEAAYQRVRTGRALVSEAMVLSMWAA